MMRRLLLLGYMIAAVGAAMAQGTPFLKNYSADEYQAQDINFDIDVDKNGTVYAANFEGLLYYDNAIWRILYTSGYTGISRITVIYIDKNNVVWVGGYNYFGKVSHRPNGQLYLERVGGVDQVRGEVYEIWEKDDALRFLVSSGNICEVKNGKVSVVKTINKDILNVGIMDIVSPEEIDDNQSVMVLTEITQEEPLDNGLIAKVKKNKGIVVTDTVGRQLYTITEKEGLLNNNVSWVAYDGHGVLWGASENGLFSIGIPSAFTHFSEYEGLKGDVISLEEYQGKIYAGTMTGLYRLEGRTFQQVGDISHACWAQTKSINGLLAATSNGIYGVFPDGSVRQLSTSSSTALLIDGVYVYSGEIDGVYLTHTKTNVRKRVSDLEKVTKIIKDSKGTIWLQSMYGEIQYKRANEAEFKAFKKQDTAEEMVVTLVQTRNKLLYVEADDADPFPYPLFSYTDKSGVTWLTDHEGKHIYRWKDGQRLTDLDQLLFPLGNNIIRAIYLDGDKLWFGGSDGITVIDTSMNDPAMLTTERLLIRSITLGADSVIWGGYGEMPTSLPDLSSRSRNLRFVYSLDHEAMLGETVYRHQLNNGGWSAWADDHDAEYLNLPPGNYTFMVQARDAFGLESEVVSVSFRIKFPFYLRWYMDILYLLVALLLVYAVVALRMRKLKRDKILLEKIVDERTAEVRSAHKELVKQEKMATVGKLTQGLIDRILNPLNYINNFSKLSEGLVKDIEANIDDDKDKMDPENYEDTMDVLGMLAGNLKKVGEHGQNTTRTLKAMEEMLKDRTGGIVKTDLCQILRQDEEMTGTYYADDISKYHIDIAFSYPEEPVYIMANPELMSKVFMSLLSNSIYAVAKKARNTSFNPAVSLQASTTGEQMTITIYDNGVGIEDKIIDKVFDPFFTTKTTGEGSGIGLYLSHDIIQNLGGNISVQSVKDEFTEFTITIPIIKE